ncbi:MAG TPA: enolase C-terminal domain-like protein [Verrucomicrobiae bacterium]|nr:enolase C-terminal domain-like protein [Verrucomicrobiae bacterium]
MAEAIRGLRTADVRFPTSQGRHGSDALHPAPDYSAAVVVVETNSDDGIEGHGLAFTLGRGTEVVVAAIQALAPLVVGLPLGAVESDMGWIWRRLAGDGQLRWLGPEKGVIHLATAAVINALWDLRSRRAGLPLWRHLLACSPEELVACIDFRHLTDALTPEDALELLRRGRRGGASREAELVAAGLPAYTTSPGWLGYADDELRTRCRAAAEAGFELVKLKVGGDPLADRRRCAVARDELGPGRRLALDANQAWDVAAAVVATRQLAGFDPLWIEEPTSCDDILGHAAIARQVAPILVATGEHVHNRVMFKQLLATGGMGVCQLDACRLGGVNEVLAVLCLAALHDVPVCPHAGGVGLCEMAVHVAAFDALGVGGERGDRTVEWVDELHQHFQDPVTVERGRYRLPEAPGFGTKFCADSVRRFRFPGGAAWRRATGAAPGEV